MISLYKCKPFVAMGVVLLIQHLTTWSALAVSYSYDSLNRLTNVDYGNGCVTSYTYDAAGNRLTYSGVVTNDTVAPTLAITNPTSGLTYVTTNATVNLDGTATDDSGISLITWENFYGYGIGTATGTTNWSISGIPLHVGDNYLYVTAFDLAGNSTEAALTVTYTLPVGPPIQFSLSAGILNLSWASSANDFVLQYATNLNPPVAWNNVNNTVTTNADSVNVSIPATNSEMFFRLAK
jgi:YD repeat-containing protein